jgi:hypothetical protein
MTEARLIQVLQPVAADILTEDADASAALASRKGALAGFDTHGIRSGVAMERRSRVGTALWKTIAPRAGWVPVEKHHASGSYEWRVGDFTVRLSKTTPEARQAEAAKHFTGPQEALFEMQPPVSGEKRPTILIRLMGNPLEDNAKVDAIWADMKEARPIPLRAIAKSTTETLPTSATPPAKTTVTLPGVRRQAESG